MKVLIMCKWISKQCQINLDLAKKTLSDECCTCCKQNENT